MPVMGILRQGQRVRVVFEANAANPGASTLLTGYVPDGTNPAPTPQFDTVAPASSADHQSVVGPAFALQITVDVPDGGGSGTLEVYVDDVLDQRRGVADTIWTYPIVGGPAETSPP